MRRLLLITLLALCANAQFANAQRMVSASPRFTAGFNRGGLNRGGLFHSSFYSLPLYDPLYADYLSRTGYPVASQPPLIILQAPPAAAPAADRSAPPSQPLMIELQGDHYVRVSGPEMSGSQMIGPELIDPAAVDREMSDRGVTDRRVPDRKITDQKMIGRKTIDPLPDQPRRSEHPSLDAIHTAAVPELPPAVLVFRDGHHEEASEYTIADGILYTSGAPYNGGSWNRKNSRRSTCPKRSHRTKQEASDSASHSPPTK